MDDTITAIDGDTIQITSTTTTTLSVSDLQGQIDTLTARVQQLTNNFNTGTIAPLQQQIDALQAQIDQYQPIVEAKAAELQAGAAQAAEV